MIEFMGEYKFKYYGGPVCRYITYHLAKIPHKKLLTQRPNVIPGQKAYAFKVDTMGIVRVGSVDTVTYRSELFTTYDFITGTTYYINRTPQMITLYNQRRHRYDLLALSGILEIDEYVPFQYIERIQLADGKILLVTNDAGRIRLLPT